MIITLFITRYILNILGPSDYGIYNLVSGVVFLLTFLNGAMTASTQRYLSFAIGAKDKALLRKVFENSLFLHILIGLLLLCIIEAIGFFLFDGVLNIPTNRLYAAKVIYQFMALNIFFTVFVSPFNACLIANENMLSVAVISIIESFLKILLAVSLVYFSTDKLITYGVLMTIISVISCVITSSFCFLKYDECSIKGLAFPDRIFLKELTSFATLNLYGGICVLGRSQGLAIILNIFVGTLANAAYGIATQVAGQFTFFSSSLVGALNPQIMKSEGNNDRSRMLSLSMVASKFGFFLLCFISIPSIFEMPELLKLWLGRVPENAVLFCRLVLIAGIINQLTIGLQSAMQASGRIFRYQLVVGTIYLLNIPTAYLFLKFHFESYFVIISYVAFEIIACIFRLIIAKQQIYLSITEYFKKVILKEIIPTLVIIFSSIMITCFVQMELRFILTFLTSTLMFAVSIYFLGLHSDEKTIFKTVYFKFKNSSTSWYRKSRGHINMDILRFGLVKRK